MNFIDCYIGEAGSVHDSTIFKRSDLFSRMQNSELGLSAEEHLIGDLAYPLMLNLMVGFKNNNNLTARKVAFNTRLSKKRSVIERAFGLLKGRFRRLSVKLNMRKITKIPGVIFACCVLHNICIQLNDFDWVEEIYEEVPTEPYNPLRHNVNVVVNNNNRQLAEAKREGFL